MHSVNTPYPCLIICSLSAQLFAPHINIRISWNIKKLTVCELLRGERGRGGRGGVKKEDTRGKETNHAAMTLLLLSVVSHQISRGHVTNIFNSEY